MSRRNRAEVREVVSDPVYGSKVVTKVINQVMLDGKRSIAQKCVYGAMELAAKKLNAEPLDVFNKALENIKPVLEVKARRVGGSTYQVPMEIRPERRQTLAIRWLVLYAKQRSERTMAAKLAGELVDAYNNAGGAFKKKEDVHRMAEANKAFASYRW
ncbi:MAG: 30S ribosomal protein S7 [Clostridia bacterium]|nr:30S ribosomal protein S7 [Clostridia bacterium]